MGKVKNPDDILKRAYQEFLDELVSDPDYAYYNNMICQYAENGDKERWNLFRKYRQEMMDELEYKISVKYGISNISYYGEDV